MTRAGRLLRDLRRDEQNWKKLCGCGHSIMEHRNHKPTYEIVDGTIVETPHPDYAINAFACALCACVTDASMRPWRAAGVR